MDGAELEDAEEYDMELRAVRQEHCDTVALADALLHQQRCEAITLRVEFGIEW